jgi:hypothetical protein
METYWGIFHKDFQINIAYYIKIKHTDTDYPLKSSIYVTFIFIMLPPCTDWANRTWAFRALFEASPVMDPPENGLT